MKVGVLTMNRIINYGSVLQTYATQYILEKMGCECEIIDYRYPNEFHYTHGHRRSPIKFKTRLSQWLGLKTQWRKVKKFKKFQRQYLHLSREYTSPNDIKRNLPQYDIYMSGSDQVWNPRYIYEDTTFLMDFVPDGKRIVSYASSFSTDEIPARSWKMYEKMLRRYQHISVREHNGAALVKQLTGREAVVDLDPTLLLSSAEWVDIAPAKRMVKQPYMLIYILTYAVGTIPHLAVMVECLRKELGMQTVLIGKEMDFPCDRVFTDCSPAEFIALVRDADYVLTSSFHGTAFALNFAKPLTAIVADDKDDRIMSLLKRTRNEYCAIKADATDSHIRMNRLCDSTPSLLESLRHQSICNLKQSVS